MPDAFLDYLTNTRRQSAATVRLRGVYLRQLAAVHNLDTASAADLAAWTSKPEWSHNTLNVAIVTLRTFYRWAQETGRTATNPAAGLRTVPVPYRRPRIANEQQINTGLEQDDAMRAMILLGAECGLRVHEIAKLRPDERRGEWLEIIGKGGQQRTVHTSPELRTLLEQLEGGEWYFPSRRGGHISTSAIRKRMADRIGTNPHSLRHRAGTTVYRGTGRDLRVTQVFLGHRSPMTTAVYVHVDEQDLRAASAAARIAT